MKTLIVLSALVLLAPVDSYASCMLDRGSNLYLSEGATDLALHPPSVGSLRAFVIFVDFSDAPADESAEELYQSFIPGAVAWFDQASFGRFSFEPVPDFRWFRMPLPSTSYGFNALTFAKHRAYVNDAIQAADPHVDFSGGGVIYVVSSRGAAIPISPTLLGPVGQGISVDGTELRLGVTFGNDIRFPRQNYGSWIAVHETLHILGLPDLYLFDGSPYPQYLRVVGGWDPMSWIAPGAHLVAWHARKLGWIDEAQLVCADPSGEGTRVTLTPAIVEGGTKAVAVKLSDSKAIVAEYRARTGLDAGLCDSGLLIYTVDAKVATGFGPVEVIAASEGTNATALAQCGPKYAAPFDIGPGEIWLYTHSTGLRIELLSLGEGSATVHVGYPAPRRRAVRH
ncbi:MAG TPA: peptidase M6 [Thermoanaerobaculia bacterium]